MVTLLCAPKQPASASSEPGGSALPDLRVLRALSARLIRVTYPGRNHTDGDQAYNRHFGIHERIFASKQ
jgi:hypothetical protein